MKNIFSLLFFLSLYTISFAQTYTIEELQKKFKPENYNEKVIVEFQKSMEHLAEKPSLYEYIPGKIIAWSFMDGHFLLYSIFLIENDSLIKIEALPKDDAFLIKLNSYVPEKSRFIYRPELWTLPFVKEKMANKSYLIQVDVNSYNPRPYEPSSDILTYNLEYSTKDFKNFRLIRLKNSNSEKWIKVGKY